MLKGMLFLEVSICVRSLLRIRYFVPFVGGNILPHRFLKISQCVPSRLG